MDYHLKPHVADRASHPENGLPRAAGGGSGRRSYNPGMGRWLSRDPGGEGESLDAYAFVRNAPSTRVDPYGLWETFLAEEKVGVCEIRHVIAGRLPHWESGPRRQIGGILPAALEWPKLHPIKCGSGCMRNHVTKPVCVYDIIIDPKYEPKAKLSPMPVGLPQTVYDHEKEHIQHISDWHETTHTAFQQFGTVCLPTRCHALRNQALEELQRMLLAVAAARSADMDYRTEGGEWKEEREQAFEKMRNSARALENLARAALYCSVWGPW